MVPIALNMQEPLSWKAGRAIPVADLLKRLQALSKELAAMDQDEEEEKDELMRPAKELAHSNLMSHKDKGVRAWTAACLVDMLRVFAPTAPYTGQQLKEIFALFVRSIIPALADANNSYTERHSYVLNSLASVKSIVLLTDVPGSNALTLDLFTTVFDMLLTSGDSLTRNVEYHLGLILNTMVEEAPTLSNDVVEIILAQFLHADSAVRAGKSKNGSAGAKSDGQSTLDIPLPPSYTCAKNVCNSQSDKMAKYVAHYFSSVIMEASSYGSGGGKDADGEEDGADGPSEEDFQQLERAHRLLRELWRACPGVLQNVVPQVEQELSAENAELRLLATSAIGDLIAGIGAAGPPSPQALNPAAYPPPSLSDSMDEAYGRSSTQSFAHVHSSTYRSFLSRRNDKSASIRAAWTTSVGRILATSAGGSGLDTAEEKGMVAGLAQMLVDGDDKVRIAAIESVDLFTFQGLIDKLGALGGLNESGSFFHNLADRVKDRKQAVRADAIKVLGKIWGVCSGEIASGNAKIKELVGGAPSGILNACYVNDTETKAFIDHALFDTLLPVGFPALKKSSGKDATDSATADKIRAQRLLLIFDSLDDKAQKVFLTLVVLRPKQHAPFFTAFLKCCDEYNGGVTEGDASSIKDRLNKLIDVFANMSADPHRTREDLKKFAKLHDRRCYVLMRFCTAPESDYAKVRKSLKELERRLVPAQSAIWDTLQLMVLRCSNVYVNRSHIGPIIDISQSNELDLGHAANEMLKHITTNNPAVFKTHISDLCQTLEQQAPAADNTTQTEMQDALKACSSFARRFPEALPKDRSFYKALMAYARYDTNPSSAKYATTIVMCASEKKQMYARDLLKTCLDSWEQGLTHSLSKLAVMAQLMLLAAEELEDSTDAVLDVAINQVLNKQLRPDSDEEPLWLASPDEECQTKLWALRILVNRIRHYDDPESIQDVAKQTYQMLIRLVTKQGELSKSTATPKHHRAWLQLTAAMMLAKLSTKRGFDAFLGPAVFQSLALMTQDPHPEVRSRFINKVKKLLAQERLPSRFYCCVFLLAYEPSKQVQDESITWLRARARALRVANSRQSSKARGEVLELALARFLSLLAHHPDLGTSQKDLADFTAFITFYLNSVASSENINLIYHIAQRVKSVQDAIALAESYEGDLEASSKLYLMSDLAQAVIRAYEQEKNWNIQAYSGKVGMPSGIFKAMPNPKAAQEIAHRNYLPNSFALKVEEVVRSQLRSSRKRRADGDSRPAKRRATGPSAAKIPKTPAKKRRRTGITADEDEDDDMDDADPIEDEAVEPSSDRRRSGRASRKSYADTKDSDDDAEMVDWEAPAKSRASSGAKKSSAAVQDGSTDELNEDGAPEAEDEAGETTANEAPDQNEVAEDEEEDENDDDSAKENTHKRSPNDGSRARSASRREKSAAAAAATKKKRPRKTTTPKSEVAKAKTAKPAPAETAGRTWSLRARG